MSFYLSSSLFQKKNARDIIHMAVLIILECLDLNKKRLFSDSLLSSISIQI